MNPLDSLKSSPMAAALDTSMKPIPLGNYPAQIATGDDAVVISNGVVKKAGANFGKPWTMLAVKMEITDPGLKSQMGRDKLPIRFSTMLEVVDGKLAEGEEKNVGLGKLMKAAGINQPGATMDDLMGKMVTVTIKHRPDENDATIVYSEVSNVGPLQ